jgi:hypothetical protein
MVLELNKINWETQEIPRDMAKQQSLFFIDWYATKYFVTDRIHDFEYR